MFSNGDHKINLVNYDQFSSVDQPLFIFILLFLKLKNSFPGDSDGKESACNVGDAALIPGVGRALGGGNGSPLQYSHPENSMNSGAL